MGALLVVGVRRVHGEVGAGFAVSTSTMSIFCGALSGSEILGLFSERRANLPVAPA
ncbi:Hypothetical protein A7982_00860 [Minicystis rosea]|nr:Hypothetical protein A7982_00860 [Minicystis rosea]